MSLIMWAISLVLVYIVALMRKAGHIPFVVRSSEVWLELYPNICNSYTYSKLVVSLWNNWYIVYPDIHDIYLNKYRRLEFAVPVCLSKWSSLAQKPNLHDVLWGFKL